MQNFKICPRVPKLQIWLLRGWGRCLNVTLQTRAPENFRSCRWGDERTAKRAQTGSEDPHRRERKFSSNILTTCICSCMLPYTLFISFHIICILVLSNNNYCHIAVLSYRGTVLQWYSDKGNYHVLAMSYAGVSENNCMAFFLPSLQACTLSITLDTNIPKVYLLGQA